MARVATPTEKVATAMAVTLVIAAAALTSAAAVAAAMEAVMAVRPLRDHPAIPKRMDGENIGLGRIVVVTHDDNDPAPCSPYLQLSSCLLKAAILVDLT